VLAAFIAVLVAAAIEIVLRDAVGMVVGVVLVLASTAVALTIRASDLFTAGVLPPLLLVAALVVDPAGINVSRLQPDAGVAQTVIAGFVTLARWLVAAHALALVLVALRLRVTRARAAARRRGTPG
jgi:hypothetical protein